MLGNTTLNLSEADIEKMQTAAIELLRAKQLSYLSSHNERIHGANPVTRSGVLDGQYAIEASNLLKKISNDNAKLTVLDLRQAVLFDDPAQGCPLITTLIARGLEFTSSDLDAIYENEGNAAKVINYLRSIVLDPAEQPGVKRDVSGLNFNNTFTSIFNTGRQLWNHYMTLPGFALQEPQEGGQGQTQMSNEFIGKIVADYLSPEMTQKRAKSLHVVLDLDGTLMTKVPEEHDEPYNKQWFEKNRMVVGSHLIVPGAPEFLVFLLKSNFKISFYSDSRDEKRDAELIDALFIRALGSEELYRKIKPQISIHSTLVDFDLQEEYKLKTTYGWSYNSKPQPVKKSLDLVRGNDESQEHIVVVENDLQYSKDPKHTLKVPGVDVKAFGFINADIYKQNQLYFVAGLLNIISQHDSPVNALFNLQYRKFSRNGVDKYIPGLALLSKTLRHYRAGLDELQKINPELNFYGSLVEDHKKQSAEKMEWLLSDKPSLY